LEALLDNAAAAERDQQEQFRGVRKRKWGKWVSEIREPAKKTRIWLGSFESPEMAAVAHDVASLRLRGREARLNFPDLAHLFRRPATAEPDDVRAAALEAAAQVRFRPDLGCFSDRPLDDVAWEDLLGADDLEAQGMRLTVLPLDINKESSIEVMDGSLSLLFMFSIACLRWSTRPSRSIL
jgi:hypothetical protein